MTESSQRFSFWNIAKIILALLLAWFVLSKTDLTQLFVLRERISLPRLAAVIVLYFSLTLLKALQYYFLIGRRADYPRVLNIVVVQKTISNFIATSAGIASHLALFRVEQGVKVSRAALAFVLAKSGAAGLLSPTAVRKFQVKIKYLTLRVLRHFMPEALARFLLKHRWIIRPGLESSDPSAAIEQYIKTFSAVMHRIRPEFITHDSSIDSAVLIYILAEIPREY